MGNDGRLSSLCSCDVSTPKLYMHIENPSCPVDPGIVLSFFGCRSYSESIRLTTHSVWVSILYHSDTPGLALDVSVPCTIVTWTLPNYPWMLTLSLTHTVPEHPLYCSDMYLDTIPRCPTCHSWHRVYIQG